jgi:hypothetical protein
MIRSSALISLAGVSLAMASSASAYVNTMYVAGTDPSSYGLLVASLDVASTAWDFPVGAGKLDSGYKAEILDGGGNPLVLDFGVNPNKTSIKTDVYQVTAPTTIVDGSGNLNLIPGDKVFAYRLRLVGGNTNTVETLYEFGVGGIEAGSIWDSFGDGDGYFDASNVLGRGYTVAGLVNGTGGARVPIAGVGDFESTDLGIGLGYYSQLDFNWAFGDQNSQMENGKEITLLMFTRGAVIANGFGKLSGVAGQSGPSTDQNAARAPILIPAVPAPGALALVAASGLVAARRRRG